MKTIENPVYIEVILGGEMSFIIVLDEDDEIDSFMVALSTNLKRSLDWNVLDGLPSE